MDEVRPNVSVVGDFDVFAPGLMLFGVLLFVMTTSTMLARETESGAMERMRIARAPMAAGLTGLALAQLTMACIAIAAMLVAAMAMGLQNDGGYGALFVVLAVTAAAAIGLGMAVAAFARSREEAANLSLLTAILLGFLSGGFFRMPSATLLDVGASDVQVYDLLASHHAIAAMQAILAGNTLGDEASTVWSLVFLALLYLAAGASVFRWRRGTGHARPVTA